MNSRPEKGLALFYHRDSAGHAEVAPPQYVEWARKKAAELGLTFTGTADTLKAMMALNQSVNGDLYLDYGISGNQLSRPGFNALQKRALGDKQVSHIFVVRRDRLSRPDNPVDAMAMEIDLRKAGLTIVLMDGKTLLPFVRASVLRRLT